MTYKELKEELEKLTEAQLNQKVRVWGEETMIKDNCRMETAIEDYVYDSEYQEDGCFPRSDWDGDEENLRIALQAGEVFLWADFNY